MNAKTANQLARELQALQLLEDGNSLNGLHHKAIRRKLVNELVYVTDPLKREQDRVACYAKWAQDADFYAGHPADGKSLGDRTAIMSGRRAGKNTATAAAAGITTEKLVDTQKRIHEMPRPKDAPASDGTLDAAVYIDQGTLEPFRVMATTRRGGEAPIFHSYTRKADESAGEFVGRTLDSVESVCGHAAAMALEGAICEAEREAKQPKAAEEAKPNSFVKAGDLLHQFGRANDKRDQQLDINFEHISNERWTIRLTCADGHQHTEEVFATPEEPLDATIGFMVGMITMKYGPRFGEELHRKLKVWRSFEAERAARARQA